MQLAQDVPQRQPRLRIESDRRLVEKDHARLVDERARDHEALLLAAGELIDFRVASSPMPSCSSSAGRASRRDARAQRRSRRRGRRGSRRTLRLRSGFGRCGTTPMRCRTRDRRVVRRRRRPRAPCPTSARTRVVRMPIVVVFPAPFGPSRPKNSPGLHLQIERRERDDFAAARKSAARARRVGCDAGRAHDAYSAAWWCTPFEVARCEWRRRARTNVNRGSESRSGGDLRARERANGWLARGGKANMGASIPRTAMRLARSLLLLYSPRSPSAPSASTLLAPARVFNEDGRARR